MKDDIITCSKLTLELALEIRALPSPLAKQTTNRLLQNWGRNECQERHLRRGSPLACGVMCFVISSLVVIIFLPHGFEICYKFQ